MKRFFVILAVVVVGVLVGSFVWGEASVPGLDGSLEGKKWGPAEWVSPTATSGRMLTVGLHILSFNKESQEVEAKYIVKEMPPPGYVTFKSYISKCSEGPCFMYQSNSGNNITFILLQNGSVKAILVPRGRASAYFTETIIPPA